MKSPEQKRNAGEQLLEAAGWIYDAALWAVIVAGALALVGWVLASWLTQRDQLDDANGRINLLEDRLVRFCHRLAFSEDLLGQVVRRENERAHVAPSSS